MALASYLFTHFYLVIPLSPDMYYISLESHFQGDPDAVEIVGIGSGDVEIFKLQVGSVELVGHSKGE